ncbi:MAG: PIN domain-containing protein [Desulfohalobiaceae bacterium]
MKALLETGPWVALIDRSEAAHEKCVDWFEAFSGELYSTEPVLTEVLFLLSFSLQAQQAALEYVLREVVTLVPSSLKALQEVSKLMAKYADLPMDFADATLVCLGAEAGICDIVTLDCRDFSIYRLPNNQAFKIHP